MKQQDFIKKIGSMATADMNKSGVLASLTIAQAILESDWGKSGLTVAANNLFGIKGRYNGQGHISDTFEFIDGKRVNVKAEFRKYPSWQESVNDHSAFVQTVRMGNGTLRYAKVIGETDYKKACKAIQAAGYATAPTYADVLIRLIEEFKLDRFDEIEKQYQVRVFTFSTKDKAESALAKIKGLGYYAQVEEKQ